nr:hypothetical protein [Tanacetum cinerariifolium]
MKIWRLCHNLKGERNVCKELDDEGYHETLYWVIIHFGSRMIPVMEWSDKNLTEGLEPREDSKLVGTLEPVGALKTDFQSLLQILQLTSDSELEFSHGAAIAIDKLEYPYS